MTTRVNTPFLRAGVPVRAGWRLIEASDPALVEAWRLARAGFDRHEEPLQAQAAAFQRDRGIARRRVPTPYAKALAIAEAAVSEALEELIASGEVVYGGWVAGQIDGAPAVIPLALLGNRRPRGSKSTIRGTTFFDVKLYRAEDLAVAEPAPIADPPPTDDRLVEALADLFAEDPAWETLGPGKLAPIVAQRDRRFRPGNGVWAAATLVDKIKNLKQSARAEARARGA